MQSQRPPVSRPAPRSRTTLAGALRWRGAQAGESPSTGSRDGPWSAARRRRAPGLGQRGRGRGGPGQGLGEEAITSINANKFGKNWFIISSSADPLAASDQDVPGQYSAFTHSLICGINSSSLDLLGVGKFVSKKYAACAKQFGKSQAPFVTSSMTGDFFFHKRLEDASNKMRMSDGIKDADEEIERAFRQQRYSGLRVLSMNEGDGSMDQVYMSPPNIAGIPRRARPSRRPPPPPGPGGGNYLSPNAQRRIPKPRTLVHGPKNGPLSTDGPQTKPLHLSDVYREERVAHGALEFVQSHNVHANGQADTNAASHWLGTLRR